MRNPKSVFGWRHYVFGQNIVAGMLWTMIGTGAYILILGTWAWWVARPEPDATVIIRHAR